MYIFKGKHFTLGVFVPKVGHHVALNNVDSGCHVVVHECENNYPCMAAGGSHYASMPGYLKTILLLLLLIARCSQATFHATGRISRFILL